MKVARAIPTLPGATAWSGLQVGAARGRLLVTAAWGLWLVSAAWNTGARAQQGVAESPPAQAAPASGEASTQAPADAPPTQAAPASGEASTQAPADAPPAQAAEPIAADPEILAQAKKHFRQGVAFAAAGNCGAAIVEFEEAYRLVPRPNALYNIAQCHERMFRYDRAIASYERYLEEAPPDAPDRRAVEGALSTLANLLGEVHVRVNVPAEVWVDDRLAGEAPGLVFVPAGGHTLEVRAEGYIPARKEIRVVGERDLTVELKLVKAETTVQVTETTGLDPTLFWIGATATVVTATVGGFFAMRVQSLKDDAEALPAVHPARIEAKRDVEDAELTADIFFAGAALLAIGTTIVAFVTDWQQDGRPPGREDDVAGLKPVLAPGVAGIGLEARL